MYKVKFDTNNFVNKKRRNWEDQLKNDFAAEINGKEFTCKSDLDLQNRFSFIAGTAYSDENKNQTEVWDKYENDLNNFFELKNERYNTQRLRYGMYGIAQGYIDFSKILDKVKNNGRYTIPFNMFYDLRQGDFFKGCFVVITKIE